jgi:hypothetical protein
MGSFQALQHRFADRATDLEAARLMTCTKSFTIEASLGSMTTMSYDQSTANQSAGSGSSDQSVSASISGLNPRTTYHFRLVATTAGGTSLGADQTLTTASNLNTNPSFETDTSHWATSDGGHWLTGTNTTLTRDTSEHDVGSASGKTVISPATQYAGIVNDLITVTSGQTYTSAPR